MRVILFAGKKVYFTLLASSFMFPISAFAQCVETDCNTLGYDSTTSCNNGIKCPFGEYWACPEPAKPEAAILGQCTGYAKNCNIGDILYSDGTCSADVVSGKTPIAVVVYISDDKNCGQALSARSIGEYEWNSRGGSDIPGLQIADYTTAKYDYNSCGNTHAMGIHSSVSEAAMNYAPDNAPETKGKWCVPAAGILEIIYKNKGKLGAISKLGWESVPRDYWSSNHNGYTYAWYFNSSYPFPDIETSIKNTFFDVRPVIEF